MNVVSVMAHQDDEMFCLGTMLRCQARGDALWFITLTDGSKGFVQRPDISREEAARSRHDEMSALAKAAGARYTNLGEPDEFLYDAPEVRMKLIEAIRKARAEVIFTHYEKDYNLDHVTTNLLVRHCAMQSSLPVLPTESSPLPAHPAIFMIEPHGPIEFTPSHYVDITAFERRKAELLSLHKSQEEAMRAALGTGIGEMCATKSRFRGEQAGCPHAEAFVPMQQRLAVKPFSVLP
jgi:LmbE family N-acetylglucosaminyl deacetylase